MPCRASRVRIVCAHAVSLPAPEAGVHVRIFFAAGRVGRRAVAVVRSQDLHLADLGIEDEARNRVRIQDAAEVVLIQVVARDVRVRQEREADRAHSPP